MKQLSLTKLWNNSLVLEDRKLKVRDYCWASELGKPLIDRYLAMKAIKPTNPPNDRSRRKFFAGNVWEFIAGIVLWQMGIIITKQEEIWTEDMPLKVKGKLDYLIGGKPDYNKARAVISLLPFQQEMIVRFMKVIDNFENEYGNEEIEPTVHEIKSCSEYVIDKIQEGGSINGHDFQIEHYLKGLKMERGIIDYISKNDALMAERVVTVSDGEKMRKDLTELKGYLDAGQQPPPAPLILFENKFIKNFNVEYSNYLTMLYGFERPDQYSDSVKSKISRWNRVLARLKDIQGGKRGKATKKEPDGKLIVLTDNNLAAIEEMNKEGYDPYELFKVSDIKEDEED